MLKDFLKFNRDCLKLNIALFAVMIAVALPVNIYDIALNGHSPFTLFAEEFVSMGTSPCRRILPVSLSVFFLLKHKEINLKHMNLFVAYHIFTTFLFISNSFSALVWTEVPFIFIAVDFIYLKYLCEDIGYKVQNELRWIVFWDIMYHFTWLMRIINSYANLGIDNFGFFTAGRIFTLAYYFATMSLYKKLYSIECSKSLPIEQ